MNCQLYFPPGIDVHALSRLNVHNARQSRCPIQGVHNAMRYMAAIGESAACLAQVLRGLWREQAMSERHVCNCGAALFCSALLGLSAQ
eukprot:6279183-Amphidinium_carterae.2